jgi:hypothetical protein
LLSRKCEGARIPTIAAKPNAAMNLQALRASPPLSPLNREGGEGRRDLTLLAFRGSKVGEVRSAAGRGVFWRIARSHCLPPSPGVPCLSVAVVAARGPSERTYGRPALPTMDGRFFVWARKRTDRGGPALPFAFGMLAVGTGARWPPVALFFPGRPCV